MREKYILQYALEEKKITKSDLNRYERRLKSELSNLRGKLADLEAAVGRAKDRAVQAVKQVVARKKRKVSAEVKASQKLQGQYIAAIRSIPKNQRAKFQKIAKTDGREKAITAMKKDAGK